MTYHLGVIICGLMPNPWMNTWKLGICITSFHCLLLNSMWPTSWRRSSAWIREMKRLSVCWKHDFIYIIKRDQEQRRHGRKIEWMKYQLYTMRKKRNEEQNLNIDYFIVESNNSKMSSSNSFNLFVALVVWCKPKSTNH
jgi:hypothetical protein